MASYYVNSNAQAKGDHEVHVTGCLYMPTSKQYLGEYLTCHPAVVEAKNTIDNPMAVNTVHFLAILRRKGYEQALA